MTEATKLSGQRGSGAGRSDRRVTFATIDEERLGTSGNPDYVAVSERQRFCVLARTPQKSFGARETGFSQA